MTSSWRSSATARSMAARCQSPARLGDTADRMDFAYLAFSVGATFQVSDNSVLTLPLRKLVTAHAATAYFYNTAILALGINIIASLIGS